ncbi:MAG: alpha/beta fold hydrolase [Planctomycetota bacterium]|jgi:pimeloyl-ACP methyl ester carboxylesterase
MPGSPLRLSPEPGESLAVEHFPGSRPGLIYLHGFSATRMGEKSQMLVDFVSRVDRSLHRFDFRGHGDSSGEETQVTLSELIADAHCVLDHAGPSILFGSSLGGLVASWAAATRPESVAGLVLIAPAFGFLPKIHRAEAFGDPGQFEFSTRVIEDARKYDESSLAAKISTKTLLVHGKLDETVPVKFSQRFFDDIPHDDKEIWVPEDGDHRLNDHFVEICQRMERFFS